MPPWVAALVVAFGLVMVVMLVREIRANAARQRQDARRREEKRD